MPTNNHSDNFSEDEAPLDDEQLWDLLSLYVDGEADPEQAAIVEQMLSSDPAYRRDFDFMMASSKTMHMVEEVEPPISLREAVLAKTTRRPTLVGRLRAAWDRATTPAFGRYATIGSAFAVAIIGAILVWPHLKPHSGSGPEQSTVAISNQPTSPAVALTAPPVIIIPDVGLLSTKPGRITPNPPEHRSFAIVPPTVKRTVVPDLRNIGKPNDKKGLTAKDSSALHNHPLLKNNAPGPDSSGLQITGNKPDGYPYAKAMDNASSDHKMATILTSNDFGPTIAANDEPTAALPGPDNHPNPPKPNGDPVPDVKPVAAKTRIRTAALPPEVSQNIASAVIRHDQTARYDGYDRDVADNISRRELVVPVIKTSF